MKKRSFTLGWAAALLLALAFLGITMVQPAQAHPSSFSDVQETDQAHEAIETLAARGIIDGFTDGTFGPDELLTRAQATKMLVIWQNLPVSEPTATDPSPFADVDDFYADYVTAATAAGWVSGFPDGTFRPSTPLTREQMAVIAVRSLDLGAEAESLSEDQVNGTLSRFADEGAISPKARPYVALAVLKKLFAGDGGLLYPVSPLTRAQFSLVLYRADAVANGQVPDIPDAADESHTNPAGTEDTEETTQATQTTTQTQAATAAPVYTAQELALANFMDTYLFDPHNSPVTGMMVIQNAEWYGIPPLSQLVIMGAETSLGDPKLGGSVARHYNFGCLRYHGAGTPWGLLSNGKIWVAGKDWYSFPSAQVGMAAFGRYLKAGVDGFYVPILSAAHPDWGRFAAIYYGRNVSGYSSYVNRLNALERSFRAEAAEAGVSF
jgi:hypothetical protein